MIAFALLRSAKEGSMKKFRMGLFGKIVVAIFIGVAFVFFGHIGGTGDVLVRIMKTFNAIANPFGLTGEWMSLARDSAHRDPASAEDHADEIAMGAVDFGKGRVFVSFDTMFCQPFRIGVEGDAALLENVIGWLLRVPVTGEMRLDFRNGLFVDREYSGG